MNGYIKLSACFAAALLGCLTVASPAIATEKEVITVTISPTVQAQVQKASPDARKKIEAAIGSGNMYIPYHFDGSSYKETFSPEEQKSWLRNVKPLIARDQLNWYSFSDIQGTKKIVIDGLPEGRSADSVVVCPQIELISVAAADEHYDIGWKTWYPVNFADDSFELKYRAKVIGTLDDIGQPPAYFLPAKKDMFVTVLISLDKKLKVSRILSEYYPTALTPKTNIDSITPYISGVWSHNATAADKARLKQLIPKIKEEEARVCASATVTTKRPLTKE